MNDEKTSLSGFHSFDTASYPGFNDKILSDLERMMNAIRSSSRYQDVVKLYTELHEHITHDAKAHNFSVAQFHDGLITELYTKFRDIGYAGTKKDMLDSILKDVTVGSTNDVLTGYSQTRVSNVKDFNNLFNKHNESLTAHPDFFNTFQPYRMTNREVDFHFDGYLKGEELFEEGKYALEGWDNLQGTILVEFQHTFSDGETLTVYSLGYDDCELKMSVVYTGTSYEFQLRKDDLLIVSTPFAAPGKTLDTVFILTYDKDTVHIVNESNANYGDNILDAVQAPKYLKLGLPLGCRTENIHQITRYPYYSSNLESLFLLNRG